jgi:pentatricopeptide repeat protein
VNNQVLRHQSQPQIDSCAYTLKRGIEYEAQKLFDGMPQRNVKSWNIMVSAHVKSQNLRQAKAIFDSVPVRFGHLQFMLLGYGCLDGY